MKNKINSTAKLAFYSARRRKGDLQRVSNSTGYSISHLSNIVAGRRTIKTDVANAFYVISRNRQKNSRILG